jgi:hypothetical protein
MWLHYYKPAHAKLCLAYVLKFKQIKADDGVQIEVFIKNLIYY